MRYRTKPFEIEAIRYSGDNPKVISGWTGGLFEETSEAERLHDPDITAHVYDYLHETWVGVKTGQWIIKGAKGEYYPCDPEIFEAKYEPVV